jgi:hypothetical protein
MAKKKDPAAEKDFHALLFPGEKLAYPRGFPRAPWDEPTHFDERKPPGPSFTIRNYRTGGYEWHFMRLEYAPEEVQRDYHPEGLSVAEERVASARRRGLPDHLGDKFRVKRVRKGEGDDGHPRRTGDDEAGPAESVPA